MSTLNGKFSLTKGNGQNRYPHQSRLMSLVSVLALCSLTGCGLIDSLTTDDTIDTESPVDTCDALDAGLSDGCRAGLTFMQSFVSEDNFETFGFSSLPGADELSFATPVQVHYIHLDELTDHNISLDPESLLNGGNEWWFVVEHNGTPTSMVGMHKMSAGWEVTQMGMAGHIQSIEALRREHATSTDRDHSEYFLIEVPAMYLSFVAHYTDNGDLALTNVYDHSHYEFNAAQIGSADDFVEALVELAQMHESAAIDF